VELRERIIGPIAAQVAEDNESVRVDLGDFIRKLILFEQVVIESVRLLEFPVLVQKFGYDGVKSLLDSGRLRIRWSAEGIAQIEQNPKVVGSHDFGSFQLAERKNEIHKALQPINDIPGLKGRQAQKLRKAIADRILTPPKDSGQPAWAQFTHDLEANHPVLKQSVALVVAKEVGKPISPSDFELRIGRRDDGGFRSDSDLGKKLRVDALEAHELISKGLLGVAGLGQRIEYMQRFRGVTGFQPDELPLFEAKLSFLARQLDPEAHAERFERVLEIAGLPEVDPDPTKKDVDLPRLLEILESDEVHEFRTWMRSLDSLTDAEIKRETGQLRDAVARSIHSKAGKAVRFSAVTGIGVIPGGQLPAIGLGLLDSVLVDRLIPEPGPAAFLGHLYLTIFESR
jgi:hypothetical protein